MNTLAKTTLGLIAFFVLASGITQAGTVLWTGATNDWSLNTNWSPTTNPPLTTDLARFTTSGNTTPTLAAGSFTIQRINYNGNTNFTVTGAGSANTTLTLDPNTASGIAFIDSTAGTATNQTFSGLTLILNDSNAVGQVKLQPGDGKAYTIASDAKLQIGSSAAQAVILEANGSTTGSGALTINGVLTGGVAGSSIKADTSGVLNLNLAAGSNLANLQLRTGINGVINWVGGGDYGGSVNPAAGTVNLATSGITIGSTTGFAFSAGGVIGATYGSGTSTIAGTVTFTTGGGAARVNTFDVGTGATLEISGGTNGGNDTSNSVNKIGNGTLNLTKSTGNAISGSAFNVSAGTLLVNNTSGSATGTTVPVNVASGATLGGAGRITGNTTLNGGTINFSGGTIAANLGVNGGNWNGNGTVTGLATSNNGTFSIGSGANLIASGDLNVAGGTIAAAAGTSKITGSVNYSSSANSTFIGEIAGAGKTLTMNANGATLTLSGTNSYTGSTTVTAGALAITGSGNLTSAALVVNGGSLLIGNTNAITSNATTVTMGGGNLTFATGSNTSSIQTFGALTMSSNSTLDFSGTTNGNTVWFNSFTGSTDPTKILSVSNWTYTLDHLAFRTAPTSFAASQFKFDNGYTASYQAFGSGFEIIAVPEPGTILAGAILLGCLAFAERRRLKTMLNGRS